MRNKVNHRRAVRKAEVAVNDAEFMLAKAEQLEDGIMYAIEEKIFKGTKDIKGSREGEIILMNVLEMLEVWHKSIHSTACAEELLLEKQAVLKQLLSDSSC